MMKKVTTLLMTTLLLAACNNTPQAVTESASVVKNQTSVVHTSARAKSINFTHSVLQARAEVGVPYVIDISFLGAANTQMQARLETTPELAMSSSSLSNIAFGAQGKSQMQQITVTPRSEGIHFVNIYRVGETKLKPAAIKIIAGNKPLKEYMRTEGEIVEDANGRAVIEMPAEEG